MSKSILITGAAGFIGFHLAIALQARGDKVVGYDSFNDYYSPALKRKRAAELAKIGISIIEGDICDDQSLQKSIKKHQVDHLVHLAAQAGVRYSLVNPQAYVRANLEGFATILEVCRHAQLPLTYASSSSIYGANSKIPFSVEDRTDSPVSFYGATKKSNELRAHSYHHLFGIPTTGLRFFTVYGPWGRPDMAYYSFAEAIMQGKPIELFQPPSDKGEMRRDFTYIDDIVEGTVAAIDLCAPHAIFNLGNHRPVAVKQLVSLLELYLGKKGHLIFKPMPLGDVPSTYADIESSRTLLGFEPKISLEEGIKRFIDWYMIEKNSQSP
jgi:UDP-glucuronate 4-epimerase